MCSLAREEITVNIRTHLIFIDHAEVDAEEESARAHEEAGGEEKDPPTEAVDQQGRQKIPRELHESDDHACLRRFHVAPGRLGRGNALLHFSRDINYRFF